MGFFRCRGQLNRFLRGYYLLVKFKSKATFFLFVKVVLGVFLWSALTFLVNPLLPLDFKRIFRGGSIAYWVGMENDFFMYVLANSLDILKWTVFVVIFFGFGKNDEKS
jgi:hypothetical protein